MGPSPVPCLGKAGESSSRLQVSQVTLSSAKPQVLGKIGLLGYWFNHQTCPQTMSNMATKVNLIFLFG